MYEAVCRVNDYTVVPHKMQPKDWPCHFSSLGRSVQRRYYLQFQILVWLLIMVFLISLWLLVFENRECRLF